MKKERFVKICPKCGSTNITIPPGGTDIHLAPPDYCQECENRGIFPEVKKTQVEKFKKLLK
ncbi:MAG: hypothetical protein U9Q69_00860 [Nanoarchaeota archaeon]|nr:hypothetical protein [Nanoarchaeota archaeon]